MVKRYSQKCVMVIGVLIVLMWWINQIDHYQATCAKQNQNWQIKNHDGFLYCMDRDAYALQATRK